MTRPPQIDASRAEPRNPDTSTSPHSRRIAVIQRFLPSRSRGGVGHFTHGLCQALVRRGHRVTVFSQDPAPDDATYDVHLVGVRRTGRPGRLAPLTFPFDIARCDFVGFDVIHAQGDDQFIPRGHAPPVVRTMHGTSLAEAWFNGIRGASPKRFALHVYFYLMESIADLRADAVVLVSRSTRKFYPRAHAVIPNGFDVEALAGTNTEKSPRPSVLFIGEINSRKRGRLLIDVMAREVRPRVPDAELWFVSPDRVEGAGITWWGRVDDATLGDVLRRAWVMCLPSAYEGFGRPYVEAMAAGTAVVASANPGARDVLNNGEFGAIAEDGALGAALIRLLTDDAERARRVALGRVRARDFDWAQVARQYEDVYDEVIERRRA